MELLVSLLNATARRRGATTSEGEDGGIDLMDGLLMHMMSRSETEHKPSTKESVIAALPTIKMGPQFIINPNKTQCTICLENFVEGEEITHLPCDHYFHLKTNITNECRGIVSWLKQSNECPLCRFEMEGESRRSSLDMTQDWLCPGCDSPNTGDIMRGRNARCNCSVTRAVVLLIDRSPYLGEVIGTCKRIYERIVNYHASLPSTPSVTSDSGSAGVSPSDGTCNAPSVTSNPTAITVDIEHNGHVAVDNTSTTTSQSPDMIRLSILTDIHTLSDSPPVTSLESQHWDIKLHITQLLIAMLNGEDRFPIIVLCPNSRAVLRAVHVQLAATRLSSFQFHTRPTSRVFVAATAVSSTTIATQTSPVARLVAHNPITSRTSSGGGSGDGSGDGSGAGDGSSERITGRKRGVSALEESTSTTAKDDTNLTSVSGGSSSSSSSVNVESVLANATTFTSASTSASSISSDAECECGGRPLSKRQRTRSRRFPILDHVRKFIERNDIVFDELASLLTSNPSIAVLQATRDIISASLISGHWNILESSRLMAEGERDLMALTAHLGEDIGSAAVVELLLEKVFIQYYQYTVFYTVLCKAFYTVLCAVFYIVFYTVLYVASNGYVF
jgi:hypothetical protein